MNGIRLFKSTLIILVMALLAACGGGGGDSEGGGSNAIVYSGLSDAAVISDYNAEDLAMGSYAGGNMGSTPYTGFSGKMTAASGMPDSPQQTRLIAAIKNSARRLDFEVLRSADADRVVAEELPPEYGNCGGAMYGNADLNTDTGDFSGTFEYRGYCEDGVTLNGNGDFSGRYDFNAGFIRQMRLSFEILSVQDEGTSYRLSGWVEFIIHANNSETNRMDMVLQADHDGKTHWIRDYTNVHTLNGSYRELTIDGRYYDPDSGYVDVQTVQALRFETLYAWPTRGVMVVTGRNNATVRMTFYVAGYCHFEADFDADGQVDWTGDYWFTTPTSTNTAPQAAAGSDQTVAVNSTIDLDGSGSSDVDGDTLTYTWTFVQCPGGACPEFSDPQAVAPSFTAVVAGGYEIQLVVSDGEASSQPDTVIVTVTPDDPGGPEIGKISDMVAGSDPQWIYAADQDQQALYFIDTQTRKISDTLDLPDTQPVAMDYSPVDNSLYIVSAFSGAVTKVDLADNAISQMTFSDTLDGRDIVVAPALRRIYVLSTATFDSNLFILDMDSGEVLLETPVDGKSITVNETEQWIFTADRGGSPSYIYKFSVALDQLTPLQDIDAGGNGRNIAISPDGTRVILPCGGGNGGGYTIYDYDATDLENAKGEWDVGTYPSVGAFSPDGSVFFGTNGGPSDNYLYVMDATNYRQIRTLPFPNSGDYAVFTPNSDGTMVVAFSYDPYPGSGHQLFFYTDVLYEAPGAMVLNKISDMAAGSDPQYVYALDQGNQALYAIDTQAHQIANTLMLPDTQPVALDFSPADNSLYIVSAFSGAVTKVDLADNAISQMTFSDTLDGRDIVVAPTLRRIYVLSPDRYDSDLTILNMDTGAVITQVGVGGSSIVVDETAQVIFTANSGLSPSTIYKYTVAGDTVTEAQSVRSGSNGRMIAISPDGTSVVLPCGGGSGSGYTIYDYDAGNLENVSGEWDVGTYPKVAAFSPDGSIFFGSNGDPYDNFLYVMEADTYGQIRKLAFPNAEGYAVFTPNSDGTVVVGFSYDTYDDTGYQLYYFTDVGPALP